MKSRIALLLAILTAIVCLNADPTPIIIDLELKAVSVLDSLIMMQDEAVLAKTPEDMCSIIQRMTHPMTDMVRLDVRVDALSQEEGNPDDKAHWTSLLGSMRRIGITLEKINTQLQRFSDDKQVQEAYAQMEEKMKEAYLMEVQQ